MGKSSASRCKGASNRCDEVYNRFGKEGPVTDRPKGIEDGLLIFVSSANNMKNGVMYNVPQKHVGIVRRAYSGRDISLYFGVAP